MVDDKGQMMMGKREIRGEHVHLKSNLKPAAGDFGSVKRVSTILGRLSRVELCVSNGLSRESVDVDQSAETTKGVLQNRLSQSSRRTNDEQTSLVRAVGLAWIFRHCEDEKMHSKLQFNHQFQQGCTFR